MKTTLITLIFLSVGLIGCGGKNTPPPATATTPTTQPVLPSVSLRGSNLGNISQIDLKVSLPAGSDKNLLDYNGTATFQGTIKTSFPCMSAPTTINCQAQFSVGNINVQNCSVGGHTLSMQIVLLRGQKLQETYSISSIIANVSPSCYVPKTT